MSSEHFIVSARKYRPQKFDDVVGQEHISQTLKNSIKTNHLAHSFLFCGPRGVGKTTSARILAKTINCKNQTADTEACDACDSCISFNQNASFNVHELDAASNNSVDDVRSLVEQVRYPPQNGKYKIYIIDEVHMLSIAAFNAFLKTLEEPPSYAIFILATTEKHKIIPTILSRCQIFDFKRITIESMVSHLKGICAKEGITADELGLQLIAQKADGGLRDALSMFDKLTTLHGKDLKYADVLENLNILDYDYYFRIIDAIGNSNHPFVLNLFDEILNKGFEPDTFADGLAEHCRNLLISKDPSTTKLLHLTGEIEERFQLQAQMLSERFLINALQLLSDCDVNYKTAKNKRLLLEITLIKMCYIEQMITTSMIGTTDAGQKKNNVESTSTIQENKPQEYIAPAVKEPIVAEVIKPKATSTFKIPSSLDNAAKIYLATEVLVEEVREEVKKIDVVESFEEDTLRKAWYRVVQKNLDISGLGSMLQSIEKSMIYESNKIILGAFSNTQKGLLEEYAPKLISELRAQIPSDTTTIEIIIVEQTESNTAKQLTAQDVYNEMVAINPVMAKIIADFKLEHLR
jgi:DNA polymerase III subunit gamma/tau